MQLVKANPERHLWAEVYNRDFRDILTLMSEVTRSIVHEITATLKALELDDDITEARISLANITYEFEWDWIGAEKEFQRVIAMNPNYATGHYWFGGRDGGMVHKTEDTKLFRIQSKTNQRKRG